MPPRCCCWDPFGLRRRQGLLLTEAPFAASASSLALSCKQTHLSSELLFYWRLVQSRIVTKVHSHIRVFRQFLSPNWLLSSPIPWLSAGQCLCLWPWRKEACSWAQMQSWLAWSLVGGWGWGREQDKNCVAQTSLKLMAVLLSQPLKC